MTEFSTCGFARGSAVVRHRRATLRLLSSTALIPVVGALTLTPSAAHAQTNDGAGGDGGIAFSAPGGAGGAANATGPGANGGAGGAQSGVVGSGGGGGGAGETGGAGGAGGNGGPAGAAGGTTPGAAGTSAGASPAGQGGSGGGGGAHGFVGAALPVSAVTGGNGGNGGVAGPGANSGGGGGGGGFGAVVTGNGALGTITSNVTGGTGGSGGSGGRGGSGGNGGTGLAFVGGGAKSVTIGAGVTVSGGNGGAAGGGGIAGATGRGGSGIVGSNLTLANFGTIVGGTGSVNGNALTLSVLNTITNIGTLVGGIEIVSGTTTFDFANTQTLASNVSGGGRLAKAGSGTLILTGNNTYTGFTIIDAGTLQIGDGGTSGTLGGFTVTNNAALAFNRSDAFTVSNIISGTGSLTKLGAGALTLSGGNTYTGATTVSEGTLIVASNDALGSAAAGTTVMGGATLALQGDLLIAESLILNGNGVLNGGALRSLTGFNDLTGPITLGSATRIMADAGSQLNIFGAVTGTNVNLTLGGAGINNIIGNIATGTGGLVKDGTGTATLQGNNTFTGDVVVNAGELQLNNSNALADTVLLTVNAPGQVAIFTSERVGNITGDGNILLNGGTTLTAGDASNRTFAGGIFEFLGTGGFTKAGTGTLTLTGTNTYTGTTTISAGTLQIGNGGTTGSLGSGNVVNNAALVFNRSNDLTVGNIISGTGSLTKRGGGTLTLTGTNTYGGATRIESGTLALGANNVLPDASSLQIAGGTLALVGFTDTVASVDFSAGGITGNTGSALDVTGNYIQTGGTLGAGATVNVGTGGVIRLSGATIAGTLTGARNQLVTPDAIIQGDEVRVTGSLVLSGTLAVGDTQNAELAITSGGLVRSLIGDIGRSAGSIGGVSVSGSGSRWESTFHIDVGIGGTGSLTIADGGYVSSDSFSLIGVQAGSSGNVLITGAGSIWENAEVAVVGFQGEGTMTLADGGTKVADELRIAQEAGSRGTLIFGAAEGSPAVAAGVLDAPTITFGAGTGQIVFNHTSSDFTLASNIVDNGTLRQIAGTTTLSGASGGFTGTTELTGGILRVTGTLGGSVTVTGGTLGGTGTLTGAVTIGAGGSLAAGLSPGTMTIASLDLDAGSNTIFELGEAGVVGGPNNDLIRVTGNLALNGGTISIVQGAGFSAGQYTLFEFGSLTGALGNLTLNPLGGGFAGILALGANAVLMNVAGAADQVHWNGSTFAPTGAIVGGSGTWDLTSGNFSNAAGTVSGPWAGNGALAVFGGAAGGTVTIAADTVLSPSGLRFETDGYLIAGANAGSGLALAGPTGIETTAGVGATIAVGISGAGSLTKTGAGTLTLTGANTYAGDTSILGGTLQVGDGGTSGTLGGGNVLNDGALVFNRANDITVANVISGSGTLTKLGAGELTLSGANTYGGLTTVSVGTLTVANGSALGSTAAGTVVANGATLAIRGLLVVDEAITLNGSGVGGGGALRGVPTGPAGNETSQLRGLITLASDATISVVDRMGLIFTGPGIQGTGTQVLTFASEGTGNSTIRALSAISNIAGLVKNGPGLLELNAVNTFTGPFTINGGDVNLVGGSALADSVAVSMAAGTRLAVSTSETIGSLAGTGSVLLGANELTLGGNNASTSFAGVISGTNGRLTKVGTGTFTLSGVNSFTGLTMVSAGTLALGAGGSLAGTVLNNATLTNAGTINGLVTNNGALASTGALGGGLANAGGATAQIAGVVSGAVSNGGTITLTGATTGIGAVTQTAGGVFDLAGNSTTIGSLAGDGAVQLGSGTLTTGGDNASTAFAGVISGSGGLTKTGSGTFTLSGMNSFTGLTTVSAGTLAIGASGALAGGASNAATLTNAGTIAGAVSNTGSLSNTGAIGGLVTNGGTLVSTGTLGGGLANAGGATAQISGVLAGAVGNSGTIALTGATSGGAALTQSVTGTLDLAGNSLELGSLAGDGSVQLGSGTLTTGGDNSSTTFAGVISGGGGLVKTGSGTFTLSGVNTFTGLTTVSAGTLAIGASGSLSGAILNNTTLANAGSITGAVTNTAVFSNAGSVAGLVTSSGTLTNSGTLGGGLANLAGGNASNTGSIAGGVTNAGSLANSGTIGGLVTNGGTLVSTGTLGGGLVNAAGATAQISGVVSGAVGNGGTITLTGTTTGITGLMQVAGGRFDLAGFATTLGGLSGEGAVVLGSGDLTVDTAASSTRFAGVISGSGGLIKRGAQTLALAGANTFTGLVTVSEGTLLVETGGSLAGGVLNNADLAIGGTIAGLVTNNGTFLTAGRVIGGLVNNGSVQLAGQIDGAVTNNGRITNIGGAMLLGRFTQAAGGSLNLSGFSSSLGSLAGGGTIALGSGTLFVGGDNSSSAFAGVISGSGGLVKTGSGTFTLDGVNTYTGTTFVNAGTLVVGSGAAIVPASAPAVASSEAVSGDVVPAVAGATLRPALSAGASELSGGPALVTLGGDGAMTTSALATVDLSAPATDLMTAPAAATVVPASAPCRRQ